MQLKSFAITFVTYIFSNLTYDIFLSYYFYVSLFKHSVCNILL